MRILHCAAGLWEHTGGPAVSVPGLCVGLVAAGHDIVLVTGRGPTSLGVRRLESVATVGTAALGPYRLANWSPAFARLCREEAAKADIVHGHGVWLHPNWAAAAAARRHRRPFVVSPRGMLTEWALGRRALLKKVLWLLADGPALRNAALIHATSDAEAADVTRRGLGPVAVIPNGIDLGEYVGTVSTAIDAGSRELLFLSRIHPKKGLDILLDAWVNVQRRHRHARLTIAGPGERVHVEGLRASLSRLGDVGASYVGVLEGAAKREALARAWLVVLPSYSENYGMVVAEALASGTPVVTTTGTPWRSLAENDCGWWVSPDVKAIELALSEGFSLSSERRLEMGRRARKLAEAEHSVGAAAERMARAYSWLLGQDARPEFVVGKGHDERG